MISGTSVILYHGSNFSAASVHELSVQLEQEKAGRQHLENSVATLTRRVDELTRQINNSQQLAGTSLYEPPHDKTNKMTSAPSLIRVFAVRMKKA